MVDIRNFGLVGGIELAPRPGEPGKRAFDVFLDCFAHGVMIRNTGDTIALYGHQLGNKARSHGCACCHDGRGSHARTFTQKG